MNSGCIFPRTARSCCWLEFVLFLHCQIAGPSDTPLQRNQSVRFLKGTYIWEVQQARCGATGTKRKRLSLRKVWLIAAVIGLMMPLVGCAVAYVLRLQDMKVGKRTYAEPAYNTPEGEFVPARGRMFPWKSS